MAGDWIKMRTNLAEDPAVVRLASGLNLDRFAIVGRLHKIWSWANEHSIDGLDVPVDAQFLDSLVATPGFAEQLRRVGWLSGRDGSLTIPNFLRHNGESAKARALDTARKRNVRKASGKCPDENRTETGPEKRREEKILNTETETRTHARGEASGESQPPAPDPVLQDLDAPAEPVVIPEAMRGPEVLKAARQWFRHLRDRAPERIPEEGSEQLREFWRLAHSWGPQRFVKAVSFSVARGYANLVEEVEQDAQRKATGRAAPAAERLTPNQQRERNNRRAFEAVFGSAPGDWEGPGSSVRCEADRLLSEPAGDLGDCAGLLPGGAGGDGGNEGGSQL